MSPRLGVAALPLVLAACGAPAATPAAPEAAPVPSTSAVAPPGPPGASALPMTAPSAAAATTTAAPAVPEGAPIPMHLVAEGFSQPVVFHALEGVTIVTSEGFVGVLDGDHVAPRPEWLTAKGAPFDRDGIVIGGRFPSSAWMAVTRDESLLNWTVELYRYRDGAWVQARPPKKNDGIFTDIVPWLDGRIVGVTSVVSRDQVAFDLLDGPKLTLMDDVGGTRATDRRCGCARGCGCPLVASGPVVAGERLSVLGRQHRYPSDAKYIMLESFWPSGTVGGYGVFQGDGGHVDVVGAVLLAPNDVVCGANVSTKGGRTTPVVKHAWSQTNPPIDSNRELPTPIDRQLISMAAAPDGTLCVGGENGGDAPNQTRAYCRCGAAPWRRLQLPDQDVTIHRIWLRSSDDVWVSGTVRPQDGRSPPVHRLYHSADASSTFRAASGHFARDLVPPFRPPPPGFPGCEHSFVWLGDGTSIPLEWTAPLRNLFGSDGQAKDVQLVEARERGRSHVGVVVPSYKAGIDLVGTMNSKLPGARPRLLCHEPRAVRTIASSVGP